MSGVSWAAVIGGAFVTAALSLILLSLGAAGPFLSFRLVADRRVNWYGGHTLARPYPDYEFVHGRLPGRPLTDKMDGYPH